jgi:hypothetical protein
VNRNIRQRGSRRHVNTVLYLLPRFICSVLEFVEARREWAAEAMPWKSN